MIKSLINGLEQKDVQATLDSYTLTDNYFPSLFPLKLSPTMKWETLGGIAGATVIADVTSYDSTAPRKTRPRVTGASGDIPKLAVGRDKIESQIMEYRLLKQYAGTTEGANALLEWIYEDQEFVYKAINGRIEWMALRAASTGKLTLDKTNNDGNVVLEYAVDFGIPSDQKTGIAIPITVANYATSKPITMIKDRLAAAKAKGQILKYMFMDQDTLDAILASDETTKKVAPWVMQATSLTQQATRASLQAYLNATFNGLTIGIIDSLLTLEIRGVQTTVSPWESGVILFSTSPVLGNTAHAPLADEFVESTVAIKAKRGHVLIKRFAVEEPLKECTIALAHAIPVLSAGNAKYLVDTKNTSWTK